jgi:hypothetical protein
MIVEMEKLILKADVHPKKDADVSAADPSSHITPKATAAAADHRNVAAKLKTKTTTSKS